MAFDNKVKVGKMDISVHDIHFRCEQKLLSPFKHQNKLLVIKPGGMDTAHRCQELNSPPAFIIKSRKKKHKNFWGLTHFNPQAQ